MHYHIITVTPFQQNCSLLWCESSQQAALVDPGGDASRIIEEVSRQRVTVTKILLTHAHLDHVGAAVELAAHFQIPIIGPQADDANLLESLPFQCQLFGITPAIEPFVPTRWLTEGEVITVGQQHLSVLHCPGHTPGHIILFCATAHLAWVGDVLFQGSIGRTDLPGGDGAALQRSIRQKLWPLGDEITFIPGHGPLSTFGHERRHNLFVKK
jgi:glyoxylase-like metal-dependent hydrolase (beta-lactamase superfamily II)